MKTAKSTLHIAEGGFLARPEKKADSDQRDAEIRPYAAQQPGFVETYGGPITGTDWGFFTAKFRSLEDMEHWQADRTHNDVQDEARDSFWYAYYVRKGRLLSAAETAEGKLLCEAVLLRDQPLSPEEHNVASAAAVETSRFGVLPYETLRGSPIPTPYVFTGPVGVLPALLHGPAQIADLPVPVGESPGAVSIGHAERGHLVEYLTPNSVFNSLPRQRSSPHLGPHDRLVTIDRVLHHASLGAA